MKNISITTKLLSALVYVKPCIKDSDGHLSLTSLRAVHTC